MAFLISIDFGTGNESDKSLLFKNINNMYIDTKSYLYKNNNRYKQYFLADKGYDTKKITQKGQSSFGAENIN